MSDTAAADGYFVGLISGTSCDGVDAAVVAFHGTQATVISALTHPYPRDLKAHAQALAQPGANEVDRLGQIDRQIADHFADAALRVIALAQLTPRDVCAIGSHGQTIRHRPAVAQPFTLQIGDGNRIAERTGITTVADFRRRDMAAGGQGAPLAPAFHRAMLGELSTSVAVVNIGGIANVSLIAPSGSLTGFDTGPGNTLMDYWIAKHRGDSYDHSGDWAATGDVNEALLAALLTDDYFDLAAPKSTGPEYFSPHWLGERLRLAGAETLAPATVQRTLLECTARSLTDALHKASAAPTPDDQDVSHPVCAANTALSDIYICGGGVHNSLLMTRISALMAGASVQSTAARSIDPDFVEAAAFAWLARQTLAGLPGNEPMVTGAVGPRVLGAIYPG